MAPDPRFEKQVLRQFGATYFPSLNVLKWLDEHVSFRLSILFAYLFGKSELAVQLLRLLATTGNFCKTALQPIGVFVGSVPLPAKQDSALLSVLSIAFSHHDLVY